MRRWLYPGVYPTWALLLMMAACSVALAWISFGLVTDGMANVSFLKRYGLMAVAEGGLVQTLEIGGKGALALLSYLGFKGIEVELVQRWRSRRS